MTMRSLELPLTALGDPPSTARVRVAVLDPQTRLRRAATALGLGLLAAAIAVPIPLVHFILVPGALVVGVVLAARRMRERETFDGAEGRCPHCGSDQRFTVFGGFRLPKRVDCSACHHDLFIGER
jgi:hypothetical protein